MSAMCNLSEGIEEKGRAEGLIEGEAGLIQKMYKKRNVCRADSLCYRKNDRRSGNNYFLNALIDHILSIRARLACSHTGCTTLYFVGGNEIKYGGTKDDV